MIETPSQVHLIATLAPLLSGQSLDDCQSPEDPSCQGGVAAAAAFARYYTRKNSILDSNETTTTTTATTTQESAHDPYLFLAHFDKESPFVSMSPLGWASNRFVLEMLPGVRAKAFLSGPSILLQNFGDSGAVSQRDISSLQSKELPLLLSNVQVPLGNSWYPYNEAVFLDRETRLAVMYIRASNQPHTVSQVDSVTGGLNYIAQLNWDNDCETATSTSRSDENNVIVKREQSTKLFQSYVENFTASSSSRQVGDDTTKDEEVPLCWIPVIIMADVTSNFEQLLPAVLMHEHPAALFVDLEENSPPLRAPRKITTNNGKPNQYMWLISYQHEQNMYDHLVLTLSQDPRHTRIENATLIHHELAVDIFDDTDDTTSDVNVNVNANEQPGVRDELYNETIYTLAELAREAQINDPIVAQSLPMPLHREGDYRRCKAGACEIGALFLDAMVWHTERTSADIKDAAVVAYGNSGGFRGHGWDEGAVRISNIWDGLPFPNNLCTGKLSGVSLFRLFNYSVSVATFESQDTEFGDRLLQVSSGVRLTYNTELKSSRLVKMEIWDREAQDYLPLERLKLYSFVTDSYLCRGFKPFSTYVSADELVYPGEIPGKVDPAALVQDVVADYLRTTFGDKNITFSPSAEGRMFNATNATRPLNLIQTQDSCGVHEFWNEQTFSCVSCPSTAGVTFLKESLEFQIDQQKDDMTSLTQEIGFVNTLTYPVTIVSRVKPDWVSVAKLASQPDAEAVWENVLPGQSTPLFVTPSAATLEEGTATGTVIFGVLNDQQFPGCQRPGTSFRVIVRIDPPEDLNQLGSVRLVGWVLSSIVIFTSLFFIGWVFLNRHTRIVKILQPTFLVMLSFGVGVMGSALIPLGFDDEIVSVDACSSSCMAFPWLLSMGFTIAMSALFSKLWRLNKLVDVATSGVRRIKVEEKDVLGPFVVLFSINFAALLVWTLVDPLKWERNETAGQPWNTYGSCRAEDGSVTLAMGLLVGGVNISTFVVACYQAFRARHLSDEFSESKSVGIALYSWVQLLLVSVPVLFLTDEDSVEARYFLQSGLVFAVSMSMLLIICVPVVVQKRRLQTRSNEERSRESTIAAPDDDPGMPPSVVAAGGGKQPESRLSEVSIGSETTFYKRPQQGPLSLSTDATPGPHGRGGDNHHHNLSRMTTSSQATTETNLSNGQDTKPNGFADHSYLESVREEPRLEVNPEMSDNVKLSSQEHATIMKAAAIEKGKTEHVNSDEAFVQDDE